MKRKPVAELKVIICEKIVEGGGTLREVCRLPGMPSHMTVYRWRRADAKFATELRAARLAGYRKLEMACIEVAHRLNPNSKEADWKLLDSLQWELGKRRKALGISKGLAPPETRASWRRTARQEDLAGRRKKWIDPLEIQWRKNFKSAEETIALVMQASTKASNRQVESEKIPAPIKLRR
jgi:transposase-like protein